MTVRRRSQTSVSMIVGGLLSLAAVCPAFAQATTSQMDGMRLSNDEPIQIESDQLEIKEQEKKAYFTGNVKVVQGTTTMRAGKMTVLYTGEGASMTGGNADIEKIYLDNKVLLNSGTQQATADKGEFDMPSQTFILTGDQVVLSEGPNVFKGCKLTVYMETGEARLDACGGRVEILLDPKSRQQQQ
jgi:lipopolysaccharide export system protein LptA|nr:OstA-like protein [Rhizobium sp. TCK]